MRPPSLSMYGLYVLTTIWLVVIYCSAPAALAQKHRYAPEVEQRIDIAGRMSKEGNFEEARRVLAEALRLDGNCCECLNSLGITYFKEGRLKECRGQFPPCFEYRPALSGGALQSGSVSLSAGRVPLRRGDRLFPASAGVDAQQRSAIAQESG